MWTTDKRLRIGPAKLKKDNREKSPLMLMAEYTQYSTIHGISHIFRPKECLLHRVIWLTAFTSCTVVAMYIMAGRWRTYVETPTSTVVRNTHYGLHQIFFPSVTLCPAGKIIESRARSYIARVLNDSDIGNDERLDSFFKAMNLFQHPYYDKMLPYLLDTGLLLQKLESINLTDLMLSARPTCEEILGKCHWQGKKEECCRGSEPLFNIQRSEEGFCYSFNSKTSLKHHKCERTDEDVMECDARHSTSTGRGTGLELTLAPINLSDGRYLDIFLRGIRVQVNNIFNYPEAGLGIHVPVLKKSKMTATIRASVIQSTQSMSRLDLSSRNCYLTKEQSLRITNFYTQRNCLIQCRMDYIKKLCGCLPYYFNEEGTEICNAVTILCLVNHSDKLMLYKPPLGANKGFEEAELSQSLSCHSCYTSCNTVRYDVDMDLTNDIHYIDSPGFLEFFYKTAGVLRYQTSVTFEQNDLLVSFGGIAGLFLGGSILSLVELAYWSLKAVFFWLKDKSSGRRSHRNTSADKTIFVRRQCWIN